jgi:hypothetical protein
MVATAISGTRTCEWRLGLDAQLYIINNESSSGLPMNGLGLDPRVNKNLLDGFRRNDSIPNG